MLESFLNKVAGLKLCLPLTFYFQSCFILLPSHKNVLQLPIKAIEHFFKVNIVKIPERYLEYFSCFSRTCLADLVHGFIEGVEIVL